MQYLIKQGKNNIYSALCINLFDIKQTSMVKTCHYEPKESRNMINTLKNIKEDTKN